MRTFVAILSGVAIVFAFLDWEHAVAWFAYSLAASAYIEATKKKGK